MKFLLDNNVLSEWWKPIPDANVVAWIEVSEWYVPVPVIAEIQEGAEALENSVRGQYQGGKIGDTEIDDYLATKDVKPDSTTETYAALKLTIEHPSETLLYMYNSDLTATNALSAVRWNAMGSAAFERMVFNRLRDFGVSVYGVEDTPKNGSYAPSFHIINHVVYHTSLDTPELVPAEGMQRSVRAFAAIIDGVNQLTLEQLRGPGFPPKDGRGSVIGPIGM